MLSKKKKISIRNNLGDYQRRSHHFQKYFGVYDHLNILPFPSTRLESLNFPENKKKDRNYLTLITNGLSEMKIREYPGQSPPELIMYVSKHSDEVEKIFQMIAYFQEGLSKPMIPGTLLPLPVPIGKGKKSWTSLLLIPPAMEPPNFSKLLTATRIVRFLWVVGITKTEAAKVAKTGWESIIDKISGPRLFDEVL